MKNVLLLGLAAVSIGLSIVTAQETRPTQPVKQEVIRLDPALDDIIAPDAQLELVRDGFGITEGVTWVPTGRTSGHLVFTDIAANVIWKMTMDGKFSVIAERAGYPGYDDWNHGMFIANGRDPKDPLYRQYRLIGPDGLSVDKEGRVVVASYIGRTIYRIEKDGKRTLVADRYEGKRFSGPNDLTFRKDGSLYFSDTTAGARGPGTDPKEPVAPIGIYMVKDGKVSLAVPDHQNPNGLAFSPDEKYLYLTGARRTLHRYDVQPDGTAKNGQVFINTDDDKAVGSPDGVRVDQAGNIWVTAPGGAWVLSPQGKLLAKLRIGNGFEPTNNLGFGDPDYKTVYFADRARLWKIRTKIPGYHPF